jgi:O-antigen/teichoic acid export membrane protein
MAEQATLYRNFPRINAVHAMSDEFKNVGLNATILYAFSEAIVGFYSMTYRILHAPLTLIGSSISQVFYQKAAEMHAHGQSMTALIKTTVRKMLLIATPLFLAILFFGPVMFEWVLGKDWRIAGVYCQYLTPWMYLNFAIAPVLQVSVIMNKQGEYFIVSLIHNVLVLGAILIGGFVFKDIITGFIILSGVMIVFYAVVYRWILNISAKVGGSNSNE